MKPARTETYEHTISGLLRRREELMAEIALTRERYAVLANDLEAMNRILELLGYEGDTEPSPKVPRLVLFYRGELRAFITRQLRENGPLTSRQLAERLIQMEGKDARDRRMMSDVVRRIAKALRDMQGLRLVKREQVGKDRVWKLLEPSG